MYAGGSREGLAWAMSSIHKWSFQAVWINRKFDCAAADCLQLMLCWLVMPRAPSLHPPLFAPFTRPISVTSQLQALYRQRCLKTLRAFPSSGWWVSKLRSSIYRPPVSTQHHVYSRVALIHCKVWESEPECRRLSRTSWLCPSLIVYFLRLGWKSQL